MEDFRTGSLESGQSYSFLFYWMIASYISVLVYVVYFDVEELEREDLKL